MGFSLGFFAYDDNMNRIVKKPIDCMTDLGYGQRTGPTHEKLKNVLGLLPIQRLPGEIKQVGKDNGQCGIHCKVFMRKLQQSQSRRPRHPIKEPSALGIFKQRDGIRHDDLCVFQITEHTGGHEGFDQGAGKKDLIRKQPEFSRVPLLNQMR